MGGVQGMARAALGLGKVGSGGASGSRPDALAGEGRRDALTGPMDGSTQEGVTREAHLEWLEGCRERRDDWTSAPAAAALLATRLGEPLRSAV